MKLYEFALAPSAQRVRVYLAEKGLEVPTEQVNVREGALFAEPFNSMNSFHCVPFLQLDDGTVIAESMSICSYLEELDPDDLEKNFRVNTTALLYLARETIPAMLEAGKRAILVTGNTSATRGGKNYGFFASTKAAQRILAESIAREFGPQGIHLAYFIIDAVIVTPRTREVLAPGRPDDFFARPPAIAEELYRVAHQDRSAWSFRVELRPFGETW